MSAYEKGLQLGRDLLDAVQDPPTEQAVEKTLSWLLGRLLLLEGPPPYRVEDVSSEARTALVRSLRSGKPLLMAHSWRTGPWTCLVLDEPLPALKRPRGRLLDLKADEKRRFFTDSKSQRAMGRIVAACVALGLIPDFAQERSVVVGHFGNHQSFLAWRSPEPDEHLSTLRGDTDNYIKIVLDGLVRAHVLKDDRGVIRVIGTKEPVEGWDTPARPVEEIVIEKAMALKGAGEGVLAIREKTGANWKQMKTLFPEEVRAYFQAKRAADAGKPPMVLTSEHVAEAIVKAKSESITLQKATKALGYPIRPVVAAAVAQARARILKGEANIVVAAGDVALLPQTLRQHLKGDKEAAEALAPLRSAPRPKRAVVLDGETEAKFQKAVNYAKHKKISLHAAAKKLSLPSMPLRSWAAGRALDEVYGGATIRSAAASWGMSEAALGVSFRKKGGGQPKKRTKKTTKKGPAKGVDVKVSKPTPGATKSKPTKPAVKPAPKKKAASKKAKPPTKNTKKKPAKA